MLWAIERRNRRISKELRREIIELYLVNPEAANKLASSHGLAETYAYHVANESGLLPRRGENLGRTHLAAMVGSV